MAGIWGASEGAYSIVLSGGYEDDIDELNYILYTGQGGQDVPGEKQVKDQEFTRGNKGLLLSHKYNLPVRVTRGYQIKNGPKTGNMLCLCPNHHEQFDSYAFYIDPATLEIKNLDGFEGKKITTNRKHKINKEFFEYHLSQYKKNH